MTELRPVSGQDKELLWNINQKYLYEMTNYYDDMMDECGNYHYGHFDEYFTDPLRTAYFIYSDGALVGFVMVNPYSNLDLAPDHTIAEFTIFPAYRRRGLAREAANAVLDMHRGVWEIKYNEKNTGAKMLWNEIAEPYSPKVYRLNENETVLLFKR